MNWKSTIPNIILNFLLKQRDTTKANELLLWKKDVIWGQYNDGQYDTYEIYFPSMMLRIYDHSADATAPWKQIRFYHLKRTTDHKWESKISEATWTRDVHVAAYWAGHPDPRFSKMNRLSELKDEGRPWIPLNDELSPSIEIAYNRFIEAKKIETNDEIDLEWQTEDQRTLEDTIELLKIRSESDKQHYGKVVE